MICCKIIADFDNQNANFSGMLKKISQHASVLWENKSLYVAEVDGDFLTEKRIIRILKLNNYTKVFVDIYSRDNQPEETESINWWLEDKLMKISYNQYEQENQEMLKNTMKGLKMLNQEVDVLLKQQQEEAGNSGTRNKERKKG